MHWNFDHSQAIARKHPVNTPTEHLNTYDFFYIFVLFPCSVVYNCVLHHVYFIIKRATGAKSSRLSCLLCQLHPSVISCLSVVRLSYAIYSIWTIALTFALSPMFYCMPGVTVQTFTSFTGHCHCQCMVGRPWRKRSPDFIQSFELQGRTHNLKCGINQWGHDGMYPLHVGWRSFVLYIVNEDRYWNTTKTVAHEQCPQMLL